MTDNDNNLLY